MGRWGGGFRRAVGEAKIERHVLQLDSLTVSHMVLTAVPDGTKLKKCECGGLAP